MATIDRAPGKASPASRVDDGLLSFQWGAFEFQDLLWEQWSHAEEADLEPVRDWFFSPSQKAHLWTFSPVRPTNRNPYTIQHPPPPPLTPYPYGNRANRKARARAHRGKGGPASTRTVKYETRTFKYVVADRVDLSQGCWTH